MSGDLTGLCLYIYKTFFVLFTDPKSKKEKREKDRRQKSFKTKDHHRVYDEPDLGFDPEPTRSSSRQNPDPKNHLRPKRKQKQLQREEVILFSSCNKSTERCYDNGRVQVIIV